MQFYTPDRGSFRDVVYSICMLRDLQEHISLCVSLILSYIVRPLCNPSLISKSLCSMFCHVSGILLPDGICCNIPSFLHTFDRDLLVN